MKITHEEYLKQILSSKKMELRELNIKSRIAIAEFNAKREMLEQQIYSIEKQLGE